MISRYIKYLKIIQCVQLLGRTVTWVEYNGKRGSSGCRKVNALRKHICIKHIRLHKLSPLNFFLQVKKILIIGFYQQNTLADVLYDNLLKFLYMFTDLEKYQKVRNMYSTMKISIKINAIFKCIEFIVRYYL